MKTSSILTYLYDLSKNSGLLTERARVELPLNNATFKIRDEMNHFDPKDPNAKEKADYILSLIHTLISRESAKYAGNTWNGQNITKAFIKEGLRKGNPEIVEGNPETYVDTLWYKAEVDPKSRVGKINITGSYLDKNGKIDPAHSDIIYRINEKYGLTLDPNEKIIVKDEAKKQTKTNQTAISNNVQQYLIWRDKYFLPWFALHSDTGSVLLHDYNLMVKGELNDETSRASKSRQDVSSKVPEQIPEEPYDKTTIDSVIKLSLYSPGKCIITLRNIMNDTTQKQFSNQQIYNTIKALKSKMSEEYQEVLDNMQNEYKQNNPDLKEEVEKNKSSWLMHNGDYSIFDKLNGLFRLQRESKETNMTNNKIKLLKEENTFSSINTNEHDFDPSVVSSDVFNDENTPSISEEDEIKKNKLTKEVLDKINSSLKLNKEVQDILDEIREINNNNDYNNWIVNEEGNTATLASKNAKIFKQNLNLCLSHDNKIEVFKSVSELHNWLKEHNYPMPKNIQLHESVDLTESLSDQFSGLRDYLDSFEKTESSLDEDFCCGNMGDTTSASLGTSLAYLYKNKKKESLEKGAFVDKLKQLKEDDTDIASNFDSAIQNDAGFGNDSSSDTTNTSNDSLSSATNTQDDTVDLGQDGQGDAAPSGFDDININTGGYGPDEGNLEQEDDFSPIPEDEYQIVDILADSVDNIRVKVKNLTSGECEYKDLSEIDI